MAALKLDELELASLRGDLHEVSCSLNFDSHTGRGKLSLANPRYSGLRGESLSGGFRWERDVVRLEKLVLQQQKSRWVGAVADGGSASRCCWSWCRSSRRTGERVGWVGGLGSEAVMDGWEL